MKKYLIVFGLVIVTAASAQEGSGSTLKWVRRATLGASCGAGLGFDTLALHHAVSEGAKVSGLYGDSQGRPRYGLLLGINGASCAFSAFLQERHKNWSTSGEWIWIGENAVSTGLYTWSGMNLLNVAKTAAAQRTQPGTMAAAQ